MFAKTALRWFFKKVDESGSSSMFFRGALHSGVSYMPTQAWAYGPRTTYSRSTEKNTLLTGT